MWLCVCGPNILSTKAGILVEASCIALLIPALFFNNECL